MMITRSTPLQATFLVLAGFLSASLLRELPNRAIAISTTAVAMGVVHLGYAYQVCRELRPSERAMRSPKAPAFLMGAALSAQALAGPISLQLVSETVAVPIALLGISTFASVMWMAGTALVASEGRDISWSRGFATALFFFLPASVYFLQRRVRAAADRTRR